MSYNINDLFVARNSRSGYQIDQSLRFRGGVSQTLSRTISGTATSSTAATLSFWHKRGRSSGGYNLFDVRASGTDYGFTAFIPYNPSFAWGDATFGSAENATGVTNYWTLNQNQSQPALRDFSAWYHIVVQWDSNNGTSTKRQRIWVNGVEYDFYNYYGSIGSGRSCPWTRNGYTFKWGYSNDMDGYLAEVHLIDGQVLNPDNFAKENDNGVWVPMSYGGTYGSLGYYLKCDPSATNGVGHDYSGNGNNFTPSGFTTSGTGTDVMSDTPTNNFATLIPNNPTYGRQTTTPVDGNLKATFYPVVSPSHNPGAPALTTFKIPTTGKWYYEFTVSGSNNYSWGVAARNDGQELYNFTLSNRAFWGWYHIYQPGYPSNGNGSQIYSPGTGSASGGGSLSSGDVIGMAINFDNNSLTITRNGSSYATITSCNFSSFDYVLPQWGTATNGISGSAILLNAGQRAFEYTVPTDHQSLCTANLPEPTIKDGGKYFNTVLYTGNANSTQAITGVGFSPDFVWIKNRGTGGTDHLLFDAVRGVTKVLKTVGTGAEETDANAFQSFDSDGFTLGTSTSGNPTKANGSTYVAWGWDAGGSGSSNTAGSITSTVSANPSAGFSIVSFTGKTYTGNSSTDTGTVGHGLGVAPSFYVVKARNGTSDWICYHSELGNTKYLELNRTDSAKTQTGMWASTSPTSTVFTMGPFWPSNVADGKTMIAYCFAEVEGYSKFGSYTGNGSTDGPFIALSFAPAFLIIKCSSSSLGGDSYWGIFDSARSPYNPVNVRLNAHLSNSEFTNNNMLDLLSNGFKIRVAPFNALNASGQTYIYMAFAENPFGGSGVSPATAR